MNEEQFRQFLRDKVREHGTLEKAARWIGISTAYLADIINGRRGLGDKVLARIGFEREITIREKSG